MKFGKTVIIGIIAGLIGVIGGVNIENINIAQYIRYLSLVGIGLYKEYVGEVFLRFMPLLVFNVVYGIYIYRHFCCASVYFFTRTDNRIKWFIKEVVSLSVHAFIYLLMYALCGIIAICLFSKPQFSKEVVYLLGYYLLVYTLFLSITTLAINIVSILFNSSVGVLTCESVLFFAITILMFWGERYEKTHIKKIDLFTLRLNPIANIMFALHTCKNKSVNKYINELNNSFPIEFTIAYFTAVLVLFVIIGSIIVHKKEFIVNDMEDLG
ncbi:hypothetical protein SAMN02745111_01167 [Eubacterium uniforme]|uniref:ABC-2 family transporter protein n=1 Tax=Eubacterium uniforme TaxID=39495 RepID=A0A1T4VL71_9FIRM|nr:hypothetical protein [Eubacterium uniforme]SKA65686.1 hypothetical protein SAMN02745111_01167 [Eubacterium uniforme]